MATRKTTAKTTAATSTAAEAVTPAAKTKPATHRRCTGPAKPAADASTPPPTPRPQPHPDRPTPTRRRTRREPIRPRRRCRKRRLASPACACTGRASRRLLITLPRQAGDPHGPYYVIIDCGVILGTENAADKMQKVVQDIIATTGGRIDLLLATHEHWDHLSGFVQAARSLASKPRRGRRSGSVGPRIPRTSSAQSLQGDSQPCDGPRRLLAGWDGRAAATAATKLRRMLSRARRRFVHQRRAGGGEEVEPNLSALPPAGCAGRSGRHWRDRVRAGAAHDESSETVHALGRGRPCLTGPAGRHGRILGAAAAPPDTDGDGLNAPFDDTFQIPLDAAKQVQFFQDRYWGEQRRFKREETRAGGASTGVGSIWLRASPCNSIRRPTIPASWWRSKSPAEKCSCSRPMRRRAIGSRGRASPGALTGRT